MGRQILDVARWGLMLLVLLAFVAPASTALAQNKNYHDDDDDDGYTYNAEYEQKLRESNVVKPSLGKSGSSGSCSSTTTIGFDEGSLSEGQTSGLAAEIPGLSSISGTGNGAMIFDSNCSGSGCSGEDDDLDVQRGNILIISEDGNSSDPDDDAGGGTLTFVFDNPVRISSASERTRNESSERMGASSPGADSVGR